jgi:hypothetical protein
VGESWWAEHGSQLFAGLWALTGFIALVLWWFIRRDRFEVDKEMTRLDTELKALARAIDSVRTESISRFEGVVERIGLMELNITKKISELEVTRARDFVTKAEFQSAINDVKLAIQGEKKRR